MGIVRGSIARPVTVAMATVAVVLFGSISLDRLGLNLLPSLTYPTLTVRTEFEGAAPAEVEEQITRRLEQRLGVISGVRKMHSVSAAGRSDVVLEFVWGTDMDLAAIEVREKIDLVNLPLDVERPSLLRLNPNLDPIFRLALTRPDPLKDGVYDLQTLRRFADDFLKRRLDPVSGVAAAVVGGGFEDEILINVDQEKIARLGITVQSLGQRLSATNVNLSGGRLSDGTNEYLVRTVNQFETIEDIEETIIFQQGGRILRLRDIAEVIEGQKERDAIMRVNGQEAIEISLYKEGDANTVAVAANVYERLDEIREQMPPNFDLLVIYDQATFINAAISEVRTAAIQGAFLAVFVLFLFLRDVRSTLIVAATIPASVMVTFALMDIYDITLNVMSLGGIALAVGMLMDNAIVVLENIARHRSEGRSVLESAEKGASEVGGAVMAATLTTIAVFLPLAFVEGIAGQLFKDQALTVTFALVASLILAFTLIPMLSAVGGRSSRPESELSALGVQIQGGRFKTALQWLFVIPRFVFVTIPRFILVWLLRVTRFFIQAFTVLTRPLLTGFDKAYDRLSLGYAGLLGLALRARLLTLVLAVIAFLGSAALIPTLPVALIPPLAQGEFKVDLELSPGTRLELTDATLADLDYTLSKASDQLLDKTYSVAGTGGRMDASAVSGGENVGEFNVVLSPGAGAQHEAEAMSRLRDVLALIPDVQFTLDRPQLFSFSKPLEVIVSSSDLEDIREVADALALAMQGSTMFRDVESTMRAGYPEVQIEFDQDRAAALGLNVPDVASRVVSKVKGEVPTEFTFQDKKIDVRVRVQEDERDSTSEIGHLVVSGSTGPQIRLDTVADIVMGVGPADIQRIGQQRVALVRANVVGDDLGIAATKVQRILEDIPVPAGLKVIVSGQNEEMEASFRSLQFALILALIMVYLVMASLFESLLHPFIIMFTIPLAGVGAVIALAMTGTSVSVVVFIGLILLVGIVVNNAIVLIDRVNQLRQTGLSRTEAVQIGAGQRFRPILMTTMTTILGLLPMAIGLGEASELRTPMAITVIGGLLVSMLLTLIVIPVVYDLVDRKVILVDPDAPPEAAAQT
ncbi:MAG: efflux RND transporter permease subunit [Pseudomonadota bacterium]|nr:efflux RND transporter permease subunit [Pseudomonadota bacterium]